MEGHGGVVCGMMNEGEGRDWEGAREPIDLGGNSWVIQKSCSKDLKFETHAGGTHSPTADSGHTTTFHLLKESTNPVVECGVFRGPSLVTQS